MEGEIRYQLEGDMGSRDFFKMGENIPSLFDTVKEGNIGDVGKEEKWDLEHK